MNNERYDEMFDEIYDFLQELISPLRASKINRAAFDRLYVILDELIEITKESEEISIKLAGILFSIFESVTSNSFNEKLNEPVFMEAAVLGSYLSRIFDYKK